MKFFFLEYTYDSLAVAVCVPLKQLLSVSQSFASG